MEDFLRAHYLGDITDLMNDSDIHNHLSIYVRYGEYLCIAFSNSIYSSRNTVERNGSAS